MSDERSTFEILAERKGREAGEAAASWAIEPDRMTKGQMLDTLRGIQAGNPAVLDNFCEPRLSGEFGDGPTPSGLADLLGVDTENESHPDVGMLCEAWEEGVREAFWSAIEKTLLYHIGED